MKIVIGRMSSPGGTLTPTWARLLDFETTLPTAIEELMRRQKERQRA